MDVREKNSGHPHRHPWEIARAEGALSVLEPLFPLGDMADVGAGDLYVAGLMRPHVKGTVHAVESEADRVPPSPGILLSRDVKELSAQSVDLVLLLDVLEHVEHDGEFLRQCVSRIRPGGNVLITVPAYPSLFSAHDHFLKHFRRYTRRSLEGLLRQAPLDVEEIFYFYSVLWPLRVITVVIEKLFSRSRRQVGVSAWPFSESHLVTRLLTMVLKVDFFVNRRLSRWGLRVGGLSLCAKCRVR